MAANPGGLDISGSPGPSGVPFIAAETSSLLAVYKPPRMHTAPLAKQGGEGTLLAWAAGAFPEILAVRGHKGGEGGLLHRLDYETRGLLLIARNQASFDALAAQQSRGGIVKTYRAFSAGSGSGPLPSFPPLGKTSLGEDGGLCIESAFRPFGPGRKAVRPVTSTSSRGNSTRRLYRTEGTFARGIFETPSLEKINGMFFLLRLSAGFRHQLRCHLAWALWPILNDEIYGGKNTGGNLELAALSLEFIDPLTGEPRRISLE